MTQKTLTAKDLVVGNKYRPLTKYGKELHGTVADTMKKRGDRFVYYTGKDGDEFCFDNEYDGIPQGDFYLPSDVVPYISAYAVEGEFILEAHKAACKDWKKKLERKFPDLFPKRVFKPGDVIKHRGGDEYMFVTAGSAYFNLVNLTEKKVYSSDGFKVPDSSNITEDEFVTAMDGTVKYFDF